MLTLKIIDKNKNVLKEKSGEEELYLVYKDFYNEGDQIVLISDENGLFEIKLDAAMDTALVFIKNTFVLPIPFNEKKDCYPPLAFSSNLNLLSIKKVKRKSLENYRNLAFNPYDHHENNGLFPHSFANVETRGESVFASRNSIDGNIASDSHGKWPYESWGINRNPDAELTLDFGRYVVIDNLVFYTRADFPHDAWWTSVTISFDDGSCIILPLEKKDGAQCFNIDKKEISSLKISKLIKADSPSPFPALIQIEAWGYEKQI